MSEVSPLAEPQRFMVQQLEPPRVYPTDVIDSISLLVHLDSAREFAELDPEETTAQHAEALFALLQGVPATSEEWQKYGLDINDRYPASNFAVGSIFSASAMRPELAQAFADKLQAREPQGHNIFPENLDSGYLAYMALRRVHTTPGAKPESVAALEAVLAPLIPPVDSAMKALDELYKASDELTYTNHTHIYGILDSVVSCISEAKVSDSRKTELLSQLAICRDGIIDKITRVLTDRAKDIPQEAPDSWYEDLMVGITDLEERYPIDKLDLAASLIAADGALTYMNAFAHFKQYGRGGPFNNTLLGHAQATLDSLLQYAIAQRMTNQSLGTRTEAKALEVIEHLIEHLSCESNADQFRYDNLLATAKVVAPDKHVARRNRFTSWLQKRDAYLSKMENIRALGMGEILPEHIHYVEIHISSGVVTYTDPKEAASEAIAYFSRIAKGYTGLPSSQREQARDTLETLQADINAWSNSPDTKPFTFTWGRDSNTFLNQSLERTFTIEKQTGGSYGVRINNPDVAPHPSTEIELYAKEANRAVDYDELPRLSVTVRPSKDVFEWPEAGKEVETELPLGYLAKLYTDLLGLPKSGLAHSQQDSLKQLYAGAGYQVTISLPATTAFKEGRASYNHAFEYGDREIRLALPVVQLNAAVNEVSQAMINEAVKRSRTFRQIVSVQRIESWNHWHNSISVPHTLAN